MKDLSDFDKKFLLKNCLFSEIDQFGKSRNKGENCIGRQNKGTSNFEQVITAITHAIITEAYKRQIPAIPTYHINSFVITPESNTRFLKLIACKVITQFIHGKSFNTSLGDDVHRWQIELNKKIGLDLSSLVSKFS